MKISEKLHATDVFIERLRTRGKGEEKSFKIEDLYNDEKKSIGTKVFFKTYNINDKNSINRG